MAPEYYLREHNGAVTARIVDAAGAPLVILARTTPTGPALPDGTLLRVHLERAECAVPTGLVLVATPAMPPLLRGHDAFVTGGRAVFPDLRVTDSTYNLIKKAQAAMAVTAPGHPGVTPLLSPPFRVLTKRSLSDKKAGAGHGGNGGARRARTGVSPHDAIEALPGLGVRSTTRLRANGMRTCGDLARRVVADEAAVRSSLGNLGGSSIHWRHIKDALAPLLANVEVPQTKRPPEPPAPLAAPPELFGGAWARSSSATAPIAAPVAAANPNATALFAAITAALAAPHLPQPEASDAMLQAMLVAQAQAQAQGGFISWQEALGPDGQPLPR